MITQAICWGSVGVYLLAKDSWPPIRYVVGTVLVFAAVFMGWPR